MRVRGPSAPRRSLEGLSVNPRPIPLLRLLFARDAWGLKQRSSSPPPLALPPEARSCQFPTDLTFPEVQKAWDEAWEEMWSWYIAPQDRFSVDEGSDASRVWETATIPRDHQDLWINFDQRAFESWLESACPIPWSLYGGLGSLRQEEDSAEEVESAMVAGLEAILVLPFGSHFAEWPSPRILVVSAMTRSDATEYRRALSSGPRA